MFYLFICISSIFAIGRTENPSYDQGVYKPNFLNYCYDEREECKDICGCMLDKKCIVKPIPPAVKETILERHNAIRKDHLRNEPKPSGMTKLEYDEQLEAIAQCWASKCSPTTTDCLLTESYSSIGMNVGSINIEDLNVSPFLESPYSDTKPLEELWKTILEGWSREIDSVLVQQLWSPTSNNKQGAQMLHDQTLALGCAFSASPEGSFFFCAYGPGMKNGSLVYKSGQPACTTCPPGLKCKDDSEELCVKYSLYPPPLILTVAPPPKSELFINVRSSTTSIITSTYLIVTVITLITLLI